jgi:hypothetical protein
MITHSDIFSVLGRYVFLGFFTRNDISCETHECRLENALCGTGIIIVAGLILFVSICAYIVCWHLRHKTRLQQENLIFANSGYKKKPQTRSELC